MSVFSTALKLDMFGFASSNVPKIEVLILDDSSFDRMLIQRHFDTSGVGHEIDEISCLCHLEEHLQSKVYDIIIVDYFLPDGTGLEALKIIENIPAQRHACAVLTTGNRWIAESEIQIYGNNIRIVDKNRPSMKWLEQAIKSHEEKFVQEGTGRQI